MHQHTSNQPVVAATALFVIFSAALLAGCSQAASLNGFDLSNTSIDARAILRGGPPRDGIPSIQNPQFEHGQSAAWLDPDARVLGISVNGQSRAYPVAILNWHEVVNDRIDDQAVVVTYCPLCGTGMVFESEFDGQVLSFGVSGLLYQSDVLLYDRQTESLWSQILASAVSGSLLGHSLTTLPVRHTSWRAWLALHPDTSVLSRNTGYQRDYAQDPYAGYGDSPATLFPVINKAPDTWHAKEWVIGVAVNGRYKAYPFRELQARGQASFLDEFAGETLRIDWDGENHSATMYLDEELQPALTAFWFAWYAFHPDTEVFVHE